jgi:hypothetical protein
MLRALEPLEQEVNKIYVRRDHERKKYELEAELVLARADQAQQVRLMKWINKSLYSKI